MRFNIGDQQRKKLSRKGAKLKNIWQLSRNVSRSYEFIADQALSGE
jgi:hypothetical protein